jgi:hypothetical protein
MDGVDSQTAGLAVLGRVDTVAIRTARLALHERDLHVVNGKSLDWRAGVPRPAFWATLGSGVSRV